MSRWGEWGYYPKSSPRAAKGGIRAQAQRGGFGKSWWAKRWIAVLEGFDIGARLQRGRSYARNGQVLSIAVGAGLVTAGVQGSRSSPYKVRLEVKPLSKKDWQAIADVVSSQAIFGAKLLGGEMPQDIETAFDSAGLSLFPKTSRDLKTECSCPDWSNPCKHIAAVYYLLGEEFDRDPFLIFQLRGMGREQFLALLGEAAPAAIAQEVLAPEPLPVLAGTFWPVGQMPGGLAGAAEPASHGAALPRRLGPFPFWRGRVGFLESLDGIYASAAMKTSRTLGGE